MDCKKLEFPFIKIPQTSKNIMDYLDAKFNCIAGTKSNTTIDINTDRIIKLNDTYKTTGFLNNIYDNERLRSNYYPVYILYKENGQKFTNFLLSNRDFVDESSCILCNTMHAINFKKIQISETNIIGRYLPSLDDTTIIYKNYAFIFNEDPYMEDHLLLITLNHDNLYVKGSQYEILNKEVLSDVIRIFSQISTRYIMGHNYIFSGSQIHFHIHIFKKNHLVNYGLDNCINHLAQQIHTRFLAWNADENKANISGTDVINTISYTYYFNKNNKYVKIASFKEALYGYMGYLITIEKNICFHEGNENKQILDNFINVVFNFLNCIENSIKYTFNLYFPSSNNHLSILILTQLRKNVDTDDGNNRIFEVQSFRNITQFIYGKSLNIARYDSVIQGNKELIERCVKINIFPKEDIYELLENISAQVGSIFGNSNLRHLLNIPKKYRHNDNVFNLFVNFTKNLMNKPSVSEPKIIIINGRMGAGKSILYKDLKKYYPFYNEDSYVYINIDDLISYIPDYKKLTSDISIFLKTNYLNKHFNTYTNVSLHRFGTKTINNLRDDNFMHELSVNDYENIYNEILNQRIYEHGERIYEHGETIQQLYLNYYNEISVYRERLLFHMLAVCFNNNFNIVIENAKASWNILNRRTGGKLNANSQHIYYLGINLNVRDGDSNKKFLLRNILLRNIEEGRIFLSRDAIDDYDGIEFDGVIESYKNNILPKNFILIKLGTTISTPPISIENIAQLSFTKNDRLNTTFDYDNCANTNLENINSATSTNTFIGTCETVSKNINAISAISTTDILKKIVIDINNKYIMNENTISLLIYNTLKNINDIIPIVVEKHNRGGQNRITENDIKIVLGGELNIIFFIKHFFGIYEKYINLENIKELKNIIKSFNIDTHYNDIFRNGTENSSINFTILINKSIISEEQYNSIKKDLCLLITRYLLELRTVLHASNFFGTLHNIENLNNNPEKLRALSRELQINKILINTKKCVFIDNPKNYNFANPMTHIPSPIKQDNYKYLLYTNSKYLNDVTNAANFLPELNVFVSTQHLDIHFPKKELDILQVGNSINFVFADNTTLDANGGIIDIVLSDYNSANADDFNKLKKIKYTNNMYNILFNVFDETYLLKKLCQDIFTANLFPWTDPDHDKKISQYLLLSLVKFAKERGLNRGQEFNLYMVMIFSNFESVMNNNITIEEMIRDCNISPGHMFFDLLSNIAQLIGDINSYTNANTDSSLPVYATRASYDLYKTRLNNYRYEYIGSKLQESINNLKNELNKFLLMILHGFNKIITVYDVFEYNTTDNIFRDLSLPEQQIQLIQWGGYKKLYSIYKNYYIQLKGGAFFNDSGHISTTMNRDTRLYAINSFEPTKTNNFSDNQIRYLELFLKKILINTSWNGSLFTERDINSIIPLSCGSFGCSFKLINGGTGKKFILKICGGGNKAIDAKSMLKEIYNGYYTSENNMDIFNKIYGYFITSLNTDDIFFKPNVGELTYTNALNVAEKSIVKNGNLLAILMSAGEADLTKIAQNISEAVFRNGQPNTNNENILSIFATLYNIYKQIFQIGTVTACSKISKRCTYLMHSDIKPANIIFNLIPQATDTITLVNSYKIEYIDFGALEFSSTFFTKISTRTIGILRCVYGTIYGDDDRKPLSPLYDIASAIYTMLIILTARGNEMREFYNNIIRPIQTAYMSGNANNINTAYDTLYNFLLNCIISNIFANNNIFLNPENYKIFNSFTDVVYKYLNFAMCIYRYHFINIPPQADYSNIEFKNFELYDAKTNYFHIFNGKLTNNDLVNALVGHINGMVS